jgi:hypothetical protein
MDTLLIAIIIAGLGLTCAYIRAEYLFGRIRKAYEREQAMIRRELHVSALRLAQKSLPLSALRNHQHFLSKESAIRVDSSAAEWSATAYSRKSADAGIARHRELA